MTIVILAVNALEADLVEQFGVPNLRLSNHGRLSIPPDLPLHTEVLWPSIFTGVMPDEHGLTRTTAREWENPLLEFAATVGTSVVPERVLLPVGKRIQKLGFERESKSGAEYFRERGLDTVFTGRDTVDIDVPGYSEREDADEIRRLMGHDAYEPTDEELFHRKSADRFESKRERLLASIENRPDLVMCYFQTLDNLQHVHWEDEAFLREWYGRFDDLSATVQARLDGDDHLIMMSDHGMQAGDDGKGEHSDYGYYATTADVKMDSILDLKSAVDGLFDRT